VTWHLIRLDLARSEAFPEGSHEHCYLLRLPLDERGLVDQQALRAAPERASVLRSRPDEPERTGQVGIANGGWVFSYAPGEGEDEQVFHLESHPLHRGDYVTVTDDAGEALCFEVASAHAQEDV
jgi:hypothetical protein